MRKPDRLFQLTNILRAYQPITAQRLAEKLLVSEGTIYRYIDDLSLAGIPIYGEAGVGYRLSDGYELPPLQLSQGELEALVSGVNFVTALTGNKLGSYAHSLLAKIEAALPKEGPRLSEEERSVRVPISYRSSSKNDLWERVHLFIESKGWMKIVYKAESGSVTSRVVFPLGLFYWGGKWTVGSWCDLRGCYRDFRVDRIIELTASDGDCVLPGHVSLQAYITIQENK